MKKLITSIAAFLVCGTSVSMAQTATAVNVIFTPKASDVKVCKIEVPEANGILKLKDFNIKPDKKPAVWYFVPLPIEVEAKARGDKEVTYIDELKLTIHAAFMVGKSKEPTMISKEITYAEIPVGGSGKKAEGKFNAGFFISPMNAELISDKGDVTARLAAVAVEATFNGSDCTSTEKAPAIVLGSTSDIFTGKWWTKSATNPKNIKLHSIAETPFAPYYSTLFPPTVPLYGGDGAGSSSSSSSSSSTPGLTDTAADDSSADDVDTTTADEEETKPKKKSKKKKRK